MCTLVLEQEQQVERALATEGLIRERRQGHLSEVMPRLKQEGLIALVLDRKQQGLLGQHLDRRLDRATESLLPLEATIAGGQRLKDL